MKFKPWDKVIYTPMGWKFGHKPIKCIILRQWTRLRFLVATDDKNREQLIAPRYFLKKLED